jgi:hypothetical protein
MLGLARMQADSGEHWLPVTEAGAFHSKGTTASRMSNRIRGSVLPDPARVA